VQAAGTPVYNMAALADADPEPESVLPRPLHPNLSDGDYLRYRRIPGMIPRGFLEELQT
jgi:hypothetical protein